MIHDHECNCTGEICHYLTHTYKLDSRLNQLQASLNNHIAMKNDAIAEVNRLQAELVAINKGAETNIHLARSTSDENKKLKAELAALHKATDLVQHVANSETQELVRLQAENARYRGALEDLFKMMDEGLLVRDISKDWESTYYLRMMDFVMRLKKAKSALHPVVTEGGSK